LKHPQK